MVAMSARRWHPGQEAVTQIMALEHGDVLEWLARQLHFIFALLCVTLRCMQQDRHVGT